MTRGWRTVWGGKDKPWLQPVSTVYDAGKKMLGHGVGMSTLDAKARVQKDGWTYSQVLTYYYTGILLQKVYE
jgi:peptidoglycan hydrolase-like amidase